METATITSMPGYNYREDGKLHTRYSELKRCTMRQVARVVAEREGQFTPTGSAKMGFGETRHEMWAEESKATGLTPECFGMTMQVDYIEQEFATEVMPNVVLHSRPDAVSLRGKAVIDYKTIQGDPKQFRNSQQLVLYAWQLAIHGITINKLIYMCEIWDSDRTTILDYKNVEIPVTLADVSAARKWVNNRVNILQSALDVSQSVTK